MKTKISKQNRKGSVLVLAVVIVILLAIIGVGMLMLGQGTRVFAARKVADTSARLAADAGMTKVLNEMTKKLQAERGSWNYSIFPITQSSTSLDGSYSSYTYTINQKTNNKFKDGLLVSSTGTSGAASRTVNALIMPHSNWYGIGVKDSINIKSGTVFSTIPAGGDFMLLTTSIEAGKIELKPGVVIPGDVVVGPGGNVAEIIDYGPNSAVEGDTYASIEEVQFPSVQIPEDLSGLSPITINSTQVLDGSGGTLDFPVKKKITMIDLGNAEVLTVNGHLKVLVTGGIGLDKDAAIKINAGSSIMLYLDGNIVVRNSGAQGFSFDPNVLPSPGLLKIYGTPNCTRIDLKAKDSFYGAIYAPEAVVSQKAKGVIYGAIVANSLDLYAGSNFILDLKLADVNNNNEDVYFAVDRWWED